MLRVSSGALAGQLINAAAIPLLARLYGDTIIGDWALLNTIAMMVGALSDLGLTDALMTEREGEGLCQIRRVAAVFGVTFGLLGGISALLYFEAAPTARMGLPSLFSAAFLAAAVIVLRQGQVYSTLLNRMEKYSVLMKNPVVNNGVFSSLALLLALSGFREYGYYAAWLAGQACSLIHMRRRLPAGRISLRPEDYRQAIARNRRFVLYQWPCNAILQLKTQLPALLMGSMFGAGMLGQYSVTARLVNIPVVLLGSAMGRVFFQASSRMRREGRPLGEFAMRNVLGAMKLAAIPAVLMMALGDLALVAVLGDEWQMAGGMIRLLAPQAFFMFLNISVQGLSVTLEKQHYTMISAGVQTVAIILSLYVGRHALGGVYPGMALMTASFIVITAAYFIALFKAMDVSSGRYVRGVLRSGLAILLGYLAIRLPLCCLGVAATL